MSMYENFARVYDAYMDNIPYEQWGEYLAEQLAQAGIKDGLLLDLCCGTGSLTEYLAGRGYDMIGVDASEDMLEAALEKKYESGADILYLQQDMREFELYGTVRAIVCTCDSLNYLESYEDLVQVFRLVNNYLDPEGLFFFDVKTLYTFRELLGDQTFTRESDDCVMIWENSWYEEEQINEYSLTLFLEEDNGLYRRYDEDHCQRAFHQTDICRALEEAGLKLERITGGYEDTAPGEKSQRLLFTARENGKLSSDLCASDP